MDAERLNFSAVINWLESGCDPIEAAKELRLMEAIYIKSVQDGMKMKMKMKAKILDALKSCDDLGDIYWYDEVKVSEAIAILEADTTPAECEAPQDDEAKSSAIRDFADRVVAEVEKRMTIIPPSTAKSIYGAAIDIIRAEAGKEGQS